MSFKEYIIVIRGILKISIWAIKICRWLLVFTIIRWHRELIDFLYVLLWGFYGNKPHYSLCIAFIELVILNFAFSNLYFVIIYKNIIKRLLPKLKYKHNLYIFFVLSATAMVFFFKELKWVSI